MKHDIWILNITLTPLLINHDINYEDNLVQIRGVLVDM